MNKLKLLLNFYEITENGLPALGDLRTSKERFQDNLKDALLEICEEAKNTSMPLTYITAKINEL